MPAGTSSPMPQACDLIRLLCNFLQLRFVDLHVLQKTKTGIDAVKQGVGMIQFCIEVFAAFADAAEASELIEMGVSEKISWNWWRPVVVLSI